MVQTKPEDLVKTQPKCRIGNIGLLEMEGRDYESGGGEGVHDTLEASSYNLVLDD